MLNFLTKNPQGLCKKGGKCKFSHDPAVERKAAKRDLYSDSREKGEEEGMEDWDEDELNDVIKKKHGGEKSNQTDIVRRKQALDVAVSRKLCFFPVFSGADLQVLPGRGGEQQVRVVLAVPQRGQQLHVQARAAARIRAQKGTENNSNYFAGFWLVNEFVRSQDKKKELEKKDETSLEELIEEKRAQLSSRTDLTKVTLQTFVLWKKRKLREKAEAIRKEKDKKKEKYKAGLAVGLSGREMFTFDPKMGAGADGDDDEEGEEFDLSKMKGDGEGEEDDGVKVHEIKFDEFGIMDDGVDESTAEQLAKLGGGGELLQ